MAFLFMMVGSLFLLWRFVWNKPKRKQLEEYYVTTITEELVKVEHPREKTQQILWKDVEAVKLINTDQGPFVPDIWLTLVGTDNQCLIPHGSEGFDKVYEIVSKYDGFAFEKFGESMGTTDNRVFLLWEKKQEYQTKEKAPIDIEGGSKEIEFLIPWHSDQLDLTQQLKREMPKGHVLFGKTLKSIARRQDNDDVLFKVSDFECRYAKVHLTWASKKLSDSKYPSTILYKDENEVRDKLIVPDNQHWIRESE